LVSSLLFAQKGQCEGRKCDICGHDQKEGFGFYTLCKNHDTITCKKCREKTSQEFLQRPTTHFMVFIKKLLPELTTIQGEIKNAIGVQKDSHMQEILKKVYGESENFLLFLKSPILRLVPVSVLKTNHDFLMNRFERTSSWCNADSLEIFLQEQAAEQKRLFFGDVRKGMEKFDNSEFLNTVMFTKIREAYELDRTSRKIFQDVNHNLPAEIFDQREKEAITSSFRFLESNKIVEQARTLAFEATSDCLSLQSPQGFYKMDYGMLVAQFDSTFPHLDTEQEKMIEEYEAIQSEYFNSFKMLFEETNNIQLPKDFHDRLTMFTKKCERDINATSLVFQNVLRLTQHDLQRLEKQTGNLDLFGYFVHRILEGKKKHRFQKKLKCILYKTSFSNVVLIFLW